MLRVNVQDVNNAENEGLISIVIPVFNEIENLPVLLDELDLVKDACSSLEFEFIFVDNRSSDQSFEYLVGLAEVRSEIRVIRLSRNFGPTVEASISAGLDHASGQAIAVLYSDLQEPPSVLIEMINEWRKGAEVVVARYDKSRASSPALKLGARWFYALQSRLSDFETDSYAGDYRLLDRRAVEALKLLPERARYFRAMTRWIGFRVAYVDYERASRQYGTSSSTLSNNLGTALNGLVSSSARPLRLITIFGFLTSLASSAFLVLYIVLWFFGSPIAGLTTVIGLLLLGFGFTFFFLGVIGEYLSRVLIEVKQRPLYVIDRMFNLSAIDVEQVDSGMNHSATPIPHEEGP